MCAFQSETDTAKWWVERPLSAPKADISSAWSFKRLLAANAKLALYFLWPGVTFATRGRLGPLVIPCGTRLALRLAAHALSLGIPRARPPGLSVPHGEQAP